MKRTPQKNNVRQFKPKGMVYKFPLILTGITIGLLLAFKPSPSIGSVNDNTINIENLIDKPPAPIITKPYSVGKFKIGNPYVVDGKQYTPKETYKYTEIGIASWYGPEFHGKKTANGETYNEYALTAAHRTLQIPSIVKVTNLENLKWVIVRINDRGPFKEDRSIDLSKRAAELLGFAAKGLARVKIEILPSESKSIASFAKNN